jgi:outer membrane immunogenic protein
MLLGIAAGVAFAAGVSGPAMSADLPMKAAPAAIPMVAPNWTGIYVGAHVGAGWSTVESDVTLLGAVFPISSHNLNGFIGGGQVGFNYQAGWVVLGVEGTFSGSNIKGSAPCIVIASCTTKTNWIGTAAVRLGGIVGGNTLVFVKGGGAWIRDDYSASFFGVFNATGSATRTGWLVGFGTEYRFTNNWSGVIEYNFMDFDKEAVNITAGIGGAFPVNITHQMHVAKVGLNYKFW